MYWKNDVLRVRQPQDFFFYFVLLLIFTPQRNTAHYRTSWARVPAFQHSPILSTWYGHSYRLFFFPQTSLFEQHSSACPSRTSWLSQVSLDYKHKFSRIVICIHTVYNWYLCHGIGTYFTIMNRALNPDVSTSFSTSLNTNVFQANLKKQANLFCIIVYEVVTAATDL